MLIFDYEDRGFIHTFSDSMAMDSDGNLMMKLSDNMAMNMNFADIHMVSSWSVDDGDD